MSAMRVKHSDSLDDNATCPSTETSDMQPQGPATDAAIVQAPNIAWLIKSIGIRHDGPILSITHVTPSLIIQIFKRLFVLELKGLREPGPSIEDQQHNMALVIEALQQIPNLPEMDPERIVARDPIHLSRLLDLFIRVHEMQLDTEEPSETASLPVDKSEMVNTYLEKQLVGLKERNLTPIATPREPDVSRSGLSTAHSGQQMADEVQAPASNIDEAAANQGAPDVSHRMQRVFKRVSDRCQPSAAKHRPTFWESFSGLPGYGSERFMKTMARNRERDARIQTIKAQRFADQVRDFAISCQVADSNHFAAMKRREFSRKLAQRRSDEVELSRIVRETDESNRQHFMNHLYSLAAARRGYIELSMKQRAAAHAHTELFFRDIEAMKSYVTVASARTSWRGRSAAAADAIVS